MKNIAVILTGCGFKDGTEITEAVSTLISLSEFGAQYKVFAPDQEAAASNHRNESSNGNRSILDEAARISRGEILPLKELQVNEFDGVIFPGGYGVALHLCSWAQQGSQCIVDQNAKKIIEEFFTSSKPIGAWCIAPTLIAKVLGTHEVTVTIGSHAETAAEIQKTGAQHEDCEVTDFITDRAHKVITTPAYMLDAKPHEVFAGIRKATKELVEMA